MIDNLIKIADNLDSLGLFKEASEIDYLIAKVAKSSPKKLNKKLLKEIANDTYEAVLNNIGFARLDNNPNKAYKFWEGHIGLNIGWARNRTGEIKEIILKSKDRDLSKKEKTDLKKLVYEAVEAALFAFPIPTTHHKEEELLVFKGMNYAKACKCGETTDEDWYHENCTLDKTKKSSLLGLMHLKVAKDSPRKPNIKLIKELSGQFYEGILDDIEFAKSGEDIDQSYKFWENHLGMSISWAKNRVGEAKVIIMASKEKELSKKEKSELKLLIYESVEALFHTFSIPTSHHKMKDLEVFKTMSYTKACKCGETTDKDWYEKNCI
jgi:ArsR family metal-binding transcriptional regulator